MTTDPRIRDAMTNVAASLQHPRDTTQTLQALTKAAVDTIPGADFASITIIGPDDPPQTLAPTDPIIAQADLLQYELREGPCYDAATEDRICLCEDLASDDRWPTYAPKAAALGFGALMGIELPHPAPGRAALNLYSRRTWLFVDALELAEMFASHAALILGFTNTLDHLGKALDSRAVIGQAIGIVMERYQIDRERAFDFLTRVSQDSNTKLRDVAAGIADGLDDSTGRRPKPAPNHQQKR